VLDTWIQLCVFIKENDKLIGDIGVHFIDELQAEIGYTVSSEFQGKGYATEAVKEVINYLFKNLKKHRITASVDPRNLKSIELLDRIGMRKEAYFKKSVWFNHEWADDVVYAILEEEYRK
jgi:RimJ/RimL family protein N-acetyltransferase